MALLSENNPHETPKRTLSRCISEGRGAQSRDGLTNPITTGAETFAPWIESVSYNSPDDPNTVMIICIMETLWERLAVLSTNG
eukprot:2406823-Pyramimonas_sp.AAC.1